MITHNLEDALEYGNRLIVLKMVKSKQILMQSNENLLPLKLYTYFEG